MIMGEGTKALEEQVTVSASGRQEDVGRQFGSEVPLTPERKELQRYIAANFPAVSFKAFGRLPERVGDAEIVAISESLEREAFFSTLHVVDCATRRQEYHRTASELLLKYVVDHRPPDTDLGACHTLQLPQLVPPLRTHVARPPMDPRFNATSPFAGHWDEEHAASPVSPSRLPVLAEDPGVGLARVPTEPSPSSQSNSLRSYSRISSLPPDSQRQNGTILPGLRSASMVFARGSVIGSGSGSSVLGSGLGSIMGSALASGGTDSNSLSSNGRMQSIRRQMSLTLRQDSVLPPLSISSGSLERGSSAWGWLEGCGASMPNVILEGAGLAIGSSREGFEARRKALSLATTETGAIQDTCPSRRLAEVTAKGLGFLEVADGRVSRLHCMIHGDTAKGGVPLLTKLANPVVVEDQSANGTFLNGRRLARGERVALKNGDRLSLVLSLSPMLERSFIFRAGDPQENQDSKALAWATLALPTPSTSTTVMGVSRQLSPTSSLQFAGRGLKRMETSRYTTAESSEKADMICQICLGPLRACLALQPCGHNFCAPCLSHHFASLLQSGQALSCPLRCPAPEKVVANDVMRHLVSEQFEKPSQRESKNSLKISRSEEEMGQSVPRATLDGVRSWGGAVADSEVDSLPWHTHTYERGESGREAGSRQASRQSTHTSEDMLEVETEPGGSESSGEGGVELEGSSEEEGGLTLMSSLCPLWDDMLPLDAACLKSKQVEHALSELLSDNVDRLMAALEVLARLAWSDDEVRTEIAAGAGIGLVVCLMRSNASEAGLLCNACLCLMSLVRGEGPACEANQWQVAKAGGVEAVVACMAAFPSNALVQLSALLCLIPLALDNPSLQAHVATLALPAVVTALRAHPQHADVQAKGLVVLGVLGQGEDAVHDAIRQQQLAVGATGRILAGLREWGARNEEVLWAVLFSLAVLVRDGANPFLPAIRAVAAAGVSPLLADALQTYKEESGVNADDMIVTAGDYMLATLAPAAAQVMREERYGVAGLALAPVVSSSAVWAWRSNR